MKSRTDKIKYFDLCPICNSKKFNKIYNKKHIKSSFVKCLHCGLILQNPQEKLSNTLNRYQKDYFNYEVNNQINFFNLIKMTLDDFNILKILKKNSNILEIGSATGLFLKYMNENGHKTTGLEICKESVEYGKKNYNVNLINKRLEDINFKNETFDFIHFSHLIEHLNDPVNFIKSIYTLLKKDGSALITTPNSKGLFSCIYKENWRCIVDDHLFLFNINNLKMLFKKLNFKIIKIKTWGSIPKGKAPFLIKKLTDIFVKLTLNGDVTAFLIQKNPARQHKNYSFK